MATFMIKQNDTLPVLRAYFTDADGNYVDLTAASGVTFRMRMFGSAELKVEAAATVLDPLPEAAETFQVQYAWVAGDTDTPGTFEAEWEVAYPVGSHKLTMPNDGYQLVIITPEIG